MRNLVVSVISLSIILGVVTFGLADFNPPEPEVAFVHKVGVLSSNSFRLAKVEGLKDGLTDYGFVEGDNIKIITRNAEGKREKIISLAKELVNQNVEVIVTTGRIETEMARIVTKSTNIPIIFMGLITNKQEDLVQDLLKPKFNITGVQNDHAALSGKRLEFLTKLLPKTAKVLVVFDPQVIPAAESVTVTQKAAKKLGVEIETVSASSAKEIDNIFEGDLEGIDAILLMPSFFLESEGARIIVPRAIQRKIPVMGVENFVKAELFGVYGVTSYDQGKQAARILAKVLRGTKVRDIPVEPPTDLRLIVNLAVAKKLGIQNDIDGSLLPFAEIINSQAGDSNGE